MPVQGDDIVEEDELLNGEVEEEPAELQACADEDIEETERLQEEERLKKLEEERKQKEKRDKQRIHVLREILSTEQTYVDWLKVLDTEFMKPLKASIDKGGSEALLEINEYQSMFMDIGNVDY
jgi:hypothetical protein